MYNVVIGNVVKNLLLLCVINEILRFAQEDKVMHFELAGLKHNSYTWLCHIASWIPFWGSKYSK